MNNQQPTQLAVIVNQSGLEPIEGKSLIEKFNDYEKIAHEWEAKAKAIVVTDANQTTEMAMAREARKKFSNLRIDVERTRKAMKEQSLRKGQAIDAVAKFLVSLIEPIELHLRAQENFIEIERKRKEQETLIQLEQEATAAKEKREAEEKAEQERIRKENEELRLANEAKEKQLVKERGEAAERERVAKEKADAERVKLEAEQKKKDEAAAAKLEEERLAKKKVEDELQAKKDAEAKVKADAEAAEAKRIADLEAERKAAAAQSDSKKYTSYVAAMAAIEPPQFASKEFLDKAEKIRGFLNMEATKYEK